MLDLFCADVFEVTEERFRGIVDLLGFLGGFYNAIHFIILVTLTIYTGYYYNKTIVRSVSRASVLIQDLGLSDS